MHPNSLRVARCHLAANVEQVDAAIAPQSANSRKGGVSMVSRKKRADDGHVRPKAKWESKFLMWSIAVAMSILWSACGNPEKLIVGKWAETNHPDRTMEIYADGTLVMRDRDKGLDVNGNYRWLDKSNIKIGLAGLFGQQMDYVTPVKIDGDEMTFLETASSGATSYARIRSDADVQKLRDAKEKRRAESEKARDEQIARYEEKFQSDQEARQKSAWAELTNDPVSMCYGYLRSSDDAVQGYFRRQMRGEIPEDFQTAWMGTGNYMNNAGKTFVLMYGGAAEKDLMDRTIYQPTNSSYLLSCKAMPTCTIIINRRLYKVSASRLREARLDQDNPRPGMLFTPPIISTDGTGCPPDVIAVTDKVGNPFYKVQERLNNFYNYWKIEHSHLD